MSRPMSAGLRLSQALEELRATIISQVSVNRDNRNFDNLLTALISDLDDLSRTRMATDFPPILRRMFQRLNTHEDGTPIELPFDSRWSSAESQVMSPIAISVTELAQLVELLKRQVFAYSAFGINLDNLGRDYDFPRFDATHAIRIGFTETRGGIRADFPIGSLFVAENTGQRRIEFAIHETHNGDVLFRCTEPGDIGNLYEGDLIPGQPINNIGRASITGTLQPGRNREIDEQYRRRFLAFLRRRAFGGNVQQYIQEVQAIAGVGSVMVFPVWRGEGSVRISILDGENRPVTPEFVNLVQEIIDPVERSGAGASMYLFGRST